MTDNGNTIVAVEAMGGDFAPAEPVKGAVDAVNENSSLYIKLVGKKESIEQELSKYKYDDKRIEIVDATEVIETDEQPVQAIQKKKDSSLVKAMKLLKEGEADALVSCGNTGALLVGGQVLVGRIKGIERAALAFIMPTRKGPMLIIDAGANVDAKPSNLVQFAKMGYIYMRDIVGIENPRVGILNIGEEEQKGNMLVKETFPLLKECEDINFIGSVESRSIPDGVADVVVSDAFAGNLVLKMYEGASIALVSEIKNSIKSSFVSKIGGLLIKNSIKDMMKKFSIEEYGGAALLGINKMIIKSHGNSKAIEVKNSILQCVSCVQADVVGKISDRL